MSEPNYDGWTQIGAHRVDWEITLLDISEGSQLYEQLARTCACNVYHHEPYGCGQLESGGVPHRAADVDHKEGMSLDELLEAASHEAARRTPPKRPSVRTSPGAADTRDRCEQIVALGSVASDPPCGDDTGLEAA